MLFLNVIFILSSLRPFINYTYELCISIGVLLHYSTLAVLLWMGVEAANMYHMLVHVFATHERHFMLKRCLVAWGKLTLFLRNLYKLMHFAQDYLSLSSELLSGLVKRIIMTLKTNSKKVENKLNFYHFMAIFFFVVVDYLHWTLPFIMGRSLDRRV